MVRLRKAGMEWRGWIGWVRRRRVRIAETRPGQAGEASTGGALSGLARWCLARLALSGTEWSESDRRGYATLGMAGKARLGRDWRGDTRHGWNGFLFLNH